MGAACPRVRNLVIFPDSAHGISQLGYREPLESSVDVCCPYARRVRAYGPIKKHALPSLPPLAGGLCEDGCQQ